MNKTKYIALQDMIKKLFSMILFILLARLLTVDEFGSFQQIILISGLFTSIFSAGFPIAISYYHGQSTNYKQKVSVYRRFFMSQLIVSSIAVLLFGVCSSYFASIFNNQYLSELTILIMILIFSNTTVELFKNLSTVTNKLKTYLVITSTLSFISVVVSITILIVTKDVAYLVVTLAIFNFLTFLILIRRNLKFFLYKTKNKFINTKESKYIIAMGSVTLVSIINVYVDQVMVSFMLPISDYSNIRIGSFQLPFIGIITGSLLTVMVPIISRYYSEKRYDKIIETWSNSIEKATILLIPIVIFCLIFADNIIINFFSDKYMGAVILFQVYMFQWLRAVVIFGGIMGSIGLEKELFKNTAIITVLNIIFNYILILNYGVIGAAITTTVLNYLALLLLVRKIDTKLNRKFISYFPFKIYITSFILSIILSLFLKYSLQEYLSSTVYLIVISVVFYSLILLIQMKLFYNDISISRFKKLL